METEIKYPGLWAKCLSDTNPWPERKCDFLTVGEMYKVSFISMGGSYTTVYLEGTDEGFNSVQFEFYEDDKRHNIFKDPAYNPYL